MIAPGLLQNTINWSSSHSKKKVLKYQWFSNSSWNHGRLMCVCMWVSVCICTSVFLSSPHFKQRASTIDTVLPLNIFQNQYFETGKTKVKWTDFHKTDLIFREIIWAKNHNQSLGKKTYLYKNNHMFFKGLRRNYTFIVMHCITMVS